MAPGNAARLHELYGIDWTAIEARRAGLAAASGVMAPDVQARISPEVADRVLHGVEGFATFVEALEEDFSEFRYNAEEVTESAPGEFVVRGVIHARGRHSRMPLSAPFRHEWSFRDGRAVRVQAQLG
jgi:ketosteroid isomerase-like protein